MMGVSVCIVTFPAMRRSVFSFLHFTFCLTAVYGQLLGPPLDCHKTCVCASNIISCSNVNLTNVPSGLPQHAAVLDLSFNSIGRLRAGWTPVNLNRLQNLLLNNNGLTFLSSEAFVHVTKLRYLDLSSNGLTYLDEFIFEPLELLEVLLLFKNNISQIDRSAFSTLTSLQKLYLSHNRVLRFPFEVLKERKNSSVDFRLMDVSSNRIKALPLQELQSLDGWINNGVYFHNNPLTCSCELYDLVAQWHLKELSSATDFSGFHTCVIPGTRRETMAILDLHKAQLNCSEVNVLKKEAYLEQSLLLNCDTRLKGMEKTWFLPGNIPLSPASETPKVQDKKLILGPLKVEDSGVYTCHATSKSFNQTLHITVVVFNSTKSGGLDNLNTAYTTLVACLFSIVLILVYLYLAPCHCACCSAQEVEKDISGESPRSSTASLAQAREVEPVGFPFRQADHSVSDHRDQTEQNGRLNPISEDAKEWQGADEKRRRSDSVSSVSSDTPMVV